MDTPEPKSDTLMDLMEKGLRDILENERTTVEQKMQAIAAGTKLMAIKHKQPEPPEEKSRGFFDKG
jgi:hypothetical protein